MTRKVIVASILVFVVFSAFTVYFLSQKDSKSTENLPKISSQPQLEQKDPSKHDYADVDFAKKMILVDQQTSRIADIASRNSSDTLIRNLAVKISEEAKSDSQKYIGWLNDWNEKYLNLSDFPEMEGHDMYPTFTGMTSLSKIKVIEGLNGIDFDKAFINLMIEHQQQVISLQSKSGEVSAVGFGEILKHITENVNNQKKQLAEMEQIKKDKGY